MITLIFDGYVAGTAEGMDFPNWSVWTIFGVSLAMVIAFYVLRSVALFTMAKKREIKNASLSWVPLLWFYVACKLIGKIKIFGSTFEKMAVLFCVIFSIAQFLGFAYQFIIYFPLIGNFLMGRTIYFVQLEGSTLSQTVSSLEAFWIEGIYYDPTEFVWPYGNGGGKPYHIINYINAVYYTSMIFDLASLIITVLVYINLFKKYMPEHYIIMAVLSFMGLFAPCVFVARNKEPMNYNDFLRQRYQRIYGQYGMPYGAPQQPAPPHPFEEFAGRGEVDPGDPFDEFAEKKQYGTDGDKPQGFEEKSNDGDKN